MKPAAREAGSTDRVGGPPPEDARERILDVAARQFRAHGYAGVGMRTIAQAAGLRAASLYHHFPAKNDLVLAVLDAGIEAVHAAVEAALARMSEQAAAPCRLRTAIAAHLESLHARSDYTSANVRIFGQLPEAVRRRHRPTRAAYEALWDRLIAQGQADGTVRADIDPGLLRNLLIGALNATLEWVDPDRGDLAGLARQQADLLLQGLLIHARGEAPQRDTRR
jgi:AcrR family transcriptional regulator